MAYFAHADVLENGPAYVKANATKIMLISAYTFGDSFATVDAAGNDRVLTTAAGKQDASANASGGSASNHLAFVDTINSKVLWVTEETTGQAVTAGNPVTFPSLVYTSKQPVAA